MDGFQEEDNHENSRRQRAERVRKGGLKGPAKCKTCAACRKKKIKCRPSATSTAKCDHCQTAGLQCVFAEDHRRETRPSGATIRSLEATLAGLVSQLQSAKSPDSQIASLSQLQHAEDNFSGSPWPASVEPSRINGNPGSMADSAAHSQSNAAAHMEAPLASDSIADGNHENTSSQADQLHVRSTVPAPDLQAQESHVSELSPQEAIVAGFVQHGTQFSVHGVSSILNPGSPAQERNNPRIAQSPKLHANQNQTKSRLVCNAALQRQREPRLFRMPMEHCDLDGVDPELAKHFFDLHWNRQHYAYLLTYRPAIMNSIATGERWSNKLLLNAIYYTSSVYSDRKPIVANGGHENTLGERFYDRFRQLLVEAIAEPSLPTAVALLLIGSNMASQGRLSAGWNFCGLAYRMILDLGLHLMTEPSYTPQATPSHLETDIEREIRKRVYWGAFIIDSTQALYFGRPTTLPLAEARVPEQLLDTYEEQEEWMPYIDPSTPSDSNGLLISYTPQPAYANSTFNALTRLMHISSRISGAFYSMSSVRLHGDRVLPWKQSLRAELLAWSSSLPCHLHYDPEKDSIPPPHQITLHTTFHVVNILLRRPFLEGGHLYNTSSVHQDEDEIECTNSALAIWRLVASYRAAFTLRRAAYLLAYAIYSAIVVLLRHSKQDDEQRRQAISFFWTALSEQRQWFSGLQKPINLLRDLVDNLGPTYIQPYDMSTPNSLFNDMIEAVARSGTPQSSNNVQQDVTASNTALSNFDPDQYFSFDFIGEQERIISDDPLYGLFAPYQMDI